MPNPTDLHVARERKNVAEHDAVYGAVAGPLIDMALRYKCC